jgi:ubiquitin-protein ligase
MNKWKIVTWRSSKTVSLILLCTIRLLDNKVLSLGANLEIRRDTRNNQEMSQQSATNYWSKQKKVRQTAVQNS